MWSALIPIFTGLLAFAGVIFGQVVASDLNTAAKRRDVRRARVERFAELIAEDVAWLNQMQNQLFRGHITHDAVAMLYQKSPFDSAIATVMLYFRSELRDAVTGLLDARKLYIEAVVDAVLARLDVAEHTPVEINAARPPPRSDRPDT